MESLVPWAESRDPSKPRPPRMWKEGEVDLSEEHIELRMGKAETSSYDTSTPVARLRKETGDTYVVQWLLEADGPEREAVIAHARRELDFYLLELEKVDPWMYAIYHCTTASNMYSSIGWSYFPDGQEGERQASRVIKLRGKSQGIVPGTSVKKKQS